MRRLRCADRYGLAALVLGVAGGTTLLTRRLRRAAAAGAPSDDEPSPDAFGPLIRPIKNPPVR
ncbi:hypothetical protein [Gordonia sp. NPDC003376]